MYSQDGYFVHNPINRFAIGDRDPLKKNADGSTRSFIIQHEVPGRGQGVKLAAVAGVEIFNLSPRLYWPGGDEILEGEMDSCLGRS